MKKHLIPTVTKLTLLTLFAITVVTIGCEKAQQHTGVLTPDTPIQANAVIDSSNDSGVTGTAVFTQNEDQITLMIEIMGASPGLHAVHIHANGDCSAPDGSSAGGHWNPTGVAHGNGEKVSFISGISEMSPSEKMEQVVFH